MTFEVKKLAAAMLAVASVTVGLQSAQALPTTPAPLEGRTITGARVDAYDPSAVMEYDPNLDITWLRDWGASGLANWYTQLAWAANLQVGPFSGWSLPTALNEDGSGPCRAIYNCIGTQMGFLYGIELGNIFGSLSSASPDAGMWNRGPFQNVPILDPQHSYSYWTSTYEGQGASQGTYFFEISTGSEGATLSPTQYMAPWSAVAVRAGDVAAPIPEPETWAMMLMGLAAGAVTLRKRT
jgi:hypothetical protein